MGRRTITLTGKGGQYYVEHPDLAYVPRILMVDREGTEYDPVLSDGLPPLTSRQYWYDNSQGRLNFAVPFVYATPDAPGERVYVIYEI